jgi:toluene monooxygenase system ferredoxin subunit
MGDWRVAIGADEIWEGELVTCQVDAIDILFVNIGGEVRAFQDKCPHAGTRLNQGMLEGRVLTCSAHLWQFDVANGGVGVNPKNCRLISYPVRIEDGKVLVRIGVAEPEPPESDTSPRREA